MGLENYRMHGTGMGTTSRELSEPFTEGRTIWGEPYRQPLQGVVNVNGEQVPVLIERLGDKQGASDVLSCIDQQSGVIRSVKAEHARVTAIPVPGGAYLPLSAFAQIGATQAFRQLQNT